MNALKLSALASLVGISGYANAIVSGSADITVTGSLNGSNQCTIAIDNGAVLDAGVNHIASMSSGEKNITGFKAFNTAVNCTFPTAIAIKYSSSLAQASTYKMGSFLTSSGKPATYLYAELGNILPTAGGVNYAYAGVGNQDLSAISGSDTFTAASSTTNISSVAGDIRNAYTVIDSNNNPVVATAFIFPFKISIWTYPKSNGWADDIAEGILSLSATVTLELHTI